MPQPISFGPDIEEIIAQSLRGGAGAGGGYKPPGLPSSAPSQPSLAPVPRSQAEINALRGVDSLQAQQMSQQMYRQANPRGRGILGMAQELYRLPGREEKLAGYQQQATESLTQARELEDLQRKRERQDEINEILQKQKFEAGQDVLSEQGLNVRAQGVQAGQDRRQQVTQKGLASRQLSTQAFQTGAEDTQAWHAQGGGIVNTMREPSTGRNYTVDGAGNKDYVDTSRLTPYAPSRETGSVAQTRQTAQNLEQAQAQIVDDIQTSTLGRILEFSDLNAATGMFDLRRLAARVFPTGERARDIQSINRDMNNARNVAMGPILSIMGVNPTDRDMALTLEGSPTAAHNPQTWIDYVRNDFAPQARSIAMTRIQEGVSNKDPQTVESAYQELLRIADAAEQRLFGQDVETIDDDDFDPSQPTSGINGLTTEQRRARIQYLLNLQTQE